MDDTKHLRLDKQSGIWSFRQIVKGKEIKRTLDTKDIAIARRRRDEINNEIQLKAWGEYVEHRTFNEAVALFRERYLITLRPSTQGAYNTDIDHLLKHLDQKNIRDISRGDLADIENERRLAGASSSSIMRTLSCLSSIFTTSLEAEWCNHNPVPVYMKLRRRRGLKPNHARRVWFTDDVFNQITEAAQRYAVITGLYESEYETRDQIQFARDTGLRFREQFGLEWRDIDWDRRLVRVRPELAKGGKYREVPLWASSFDMLAEREARRRKFSEYLFPTADGERYSETTTFINRRFKRICATIGIDDVHWHDLRRTCGCLLLQPPHNLSILEVSQWLGHGSVVTTERHYAFLGLDHLRAKRDQVEEKMTQDRRSLSIASDPKMRF